MSSQRPRTTFSLWIHLVGLLVCAAITLGSYVVVVRPIAQQCDEVGAAQDRAGKLEHQARSTEAQQARLMEELADLQATLSESEVALEPLSRLNMHLATITGLASGHGLTIQESHSDAAEHSSWFVNVPITLRGDGTYPSCAAFLHALVETMPDMGVTGFELSGNPRLANAPCTFRLDLTWYAAPELVTDG